MSSLRRIVHVELPEGELSPEMFASKFKTCHEVNQFFGNLQVFDVVYARMFYLLKLARACVCAHARGCLCVLLCVYLWMCVHARVRVELSALR